MIYCLILSYTHRGLSVGHKEIFTRCVEDISLQELINTHNNMNLSLPLTYFHYTFTIHIAKCYIPETFYSIVYHDNSKSLS